MLLPVVCCFVVPLFVLSLGTVCVCVLGGATGRTMQDVALSYVYGNSGCVAASCVSCEPVCVCVSLMRVVIVCLASTHTAFVVSSPSLAVLHLPN